MKPSVTLKPAGTHGAAALVADATVPRQTTTTLAEVGPLAPAAGAVTAMQPCAWVIAPMFTPPAAVSAAPRNKLPH